MIFRIEPSGFAVKWCNAFGARLFPLRQNQISACLLIHAAYWNDAPTPGRDIALTNRPLSN
jgi:hypothetical protein